MWRSLNQRILLAALLTALAAFSLSGCGGDTSGLDSPDPRSYEYQYEGWCYRWVPQGEVNLDKAIKLCRQKVKQRQEYLKDALGEQYEKGPTGWSMDSCLQVLGWDRCPPED